MKIAKEIIDDIINNGNPLLACCLDNFEIRKIKKLRIVIGKGEKKDEPYTFYESVLLNNQEIIEKAFSDFFDKNVEIIIDRREET